jgi:hypothetical protein
MKIIQKSLSIIYINFFSSCKLQKKYGKIKTDDSDGAKFEGYRWPHILNVQYQNQMCILFKKVMQENEKHNCWINNVKLSAMPPIGHKRIRSLC